MCSKDEELILLQQFLRFGETRSITQQLILQELSEKSNEEQRANRAQSELKKLFERNSQHAVAAVAAQAAAARAAAGGLVSPIVNGLHPPSRGDVSPSRSHPRSSPMHDRSITSPSSNASSSMAMVSPKNNRGSPPVSTPSSGINGLPTSTPMSVGSPLNRLQNMQPFDFRKGPNSNDRKTPDGRNGAVPIPPTIPPMRMPGAGSLGSFPANMPLSYHNMAKVRRH